MFLLQYKYKMSLKNYIRHEKKHISELQKLRNKTTELKKESEIKEGEKKTCFRNEDLS